MALTGVWKQVVLFACGIVVGFLIRDFSYWEGGLRTNTIYWLRGRVSSRGQSLFDVMAACPCVCPAPAAAEPAPASQPAPAQRTASVPAPATVPPAAPPTEDICPVARETAVNNQVMVFIGDKHVFALPNNKHSLIYEMMTSLIDLRVNNILLVATELPAYQNGLVWIKYCKERGVRLHVIRWDIATPGVLHRRMFREQQSAKKFPVIRDLLRCGVNVLLSDFDILFWGNPFKHVVGDADVEGMTDGWDNTTQFGWEFQWPTQFGFVRWEARVVFLNSGFFYVRASRRTAETMDAVWRMLTKEPIWDQAAYNCQVHAPLGTGTGRLDGRGLSVRVMDAYLFSNSRVFHGLVAPATARSNFLPKANEVPTGFKWPTPWGRPIAMHVNYHLHKVQMMAYARRAFAKAPVPSLEPPVPQLAGSTALPPVPPSLVETCKAVQEAAVNRQVMVLVGDRSALGAPSATETLLHGTLTTLIQLKVNNVLLVATDPDAFLNGQQWILHASGKGIRLHVVTRYVEMPAVLQRRNATEQLSAKKYAVLRDLLRCDVNLLFSDFNTLFWDDPFRHIYDDADLEGLSDGFDYFTTFGAGIPLPPGTWFPPWEWRVEFLSSGFFYVRASTRTVKTMDAVWKMLGEAPIWDHIAFNVQVRAPLGTGAQDRLQGQGLTIRIMDVHNFPNSRLFHAVVDNTTLNADYLPPAGKTPTGFEWPTPRKRPVAMSVNLHRHKVEMMDYARRAFPQVGTSR